MDEITPGKNGRSKTGAFLLMERPLLFCRRGKAGFAAPLRQRQRGGEKVQAIFLATTTKRPFSVWLEQVERVSRVSPQAAVTPVSYSARAFTLDT